MAGSSKTQKVLEFPVFRFKEDSEKVYRFSALNV